MCRWGRSVQSGWSSFSFSVSVFFLLSLLFPFKIPQYYYMLSAHPQIEPDRPVHDVQSKDQSQADKTKMAPALARTLEQPVSK
jgi:hypothetical protein